MLRKYLCDFKEKYNKDKKVIIESFVKFYGEEYRKRIENRINELDIICHVPLTFHESLMPSDLKKYIDKCHENYIETKDLDKLVNSLVIDLDCKDKLNFIRQLVPADYLLQSTNMCEYNLVSLPIVYNLAHITHEFNHVVINNELLENFGINGLEISVRTENGYKLHNSILSEIIGERCVHDIQRIQSRMGINSEICTSLQYRYFKYIERFYTTFKDVIKYSIMSGSLNTLINSIGKENYNNLNTIIEYINLLEQEKGAIVLSDEMAPLFMKEINVIVDNMIEHYNEVRDNQIKKEELFDNLKDKNNIRILSLNNYYELPSIK